MFYSILKNLYNILTDIVRSGVKGSFEEEAVRKTIVVNLFTFVGIFFMTLFSFKSFFDHKYIHAIIIAFADLCTFSVFIYLRISKNYKVAGVFTVILMLLLNLYFIIYSSNNNDYYLWFYVFPALCLFTTNSRKGSMFIFILYGITLILFITEPSFMHTYTYAFKLRFFSTNIALYIMSFVFEKIRERTYNNLVKTNEKKTYYLSKVIEQKKQLILQSQQLKTKNKEITDSIEYSKHIQNAILPSQEKISSVIPEYFIFFKPKEAIGGDFFWISKHNNLITIAVADCTGHGIPGALMSMLGVTFLNEIVVNSGINQPDRILNNLRKKIISTLHQHDDNIHNNDGIDIAVCTLHLDNKTLEFAGANSPVLVINDNKTKELLPNKMSAGLNYLKDKKFTNQKIKIQENSMLYFFSDGFMDQFGGKENKKYLKQNFYNLLLKNSKYPVFKQKENIDKEFKHWIGEEEQIDDIIIMGINLNFILK